jgi:NAD(P)-dependent dehydrogenase (short-subunit alcohol dehydrogenase family)
VGNSDGIGLALTRRLLDDGWSVTGLSRSAGPLTDHVVDVTAADYPDVLARVGAAELCVYAAGVGELDDLPAFGFVDTKMAKAPSTPLKISADRAADVVMRCVRTGRRWSRIRAGRRC